MKILHTGDLHLQNGQILKEIKKCTDFLLEVAERERPDFTVIAGDLFDQNVPLGSEAAVTAIDFLQKLSNLCPVFIVKGTPSHEGTNLNSLERLTGVTVFDTPIQMKVGEATFSFLPAPTRASLLTLRKNNETIEDLLRDILQGWGETAKVPHILVGHVTLRGSETSAGQQMAGRDIELGVSDFALAKPTLVILGHIHKPQRWGNIFYCGSLTRLNFGEEEEKGFWIHEINDSRVESRFIKVPARKMVTQTWPDVDLSSLGPGDGLRIIARVNEGENCDFSSLEREAGERGIILRIEKQVIPVVTRRTEAISRALTYEDKLRIWLEVSGTGSENGDLFDKLSLLREREPEEIVSVLLKGGGNETVISQT